MKKCIILLFLSLFVLKSNAQWQYPAQGKEINYRIAGFSLPEVPQTTQYTLEVTEGLYDNENFFKTHIIKRCTSKTNQLIVELPSWGQSYTWRFLYTHPGNRTTSSPLYHFSTGKPPVVDTHLYRLRIIKNAKKYQQAYVICDKSRVIYDMKGNAIWYLPNIPGIIESNGEVRDLKPTFKGTMTFVTNNMAYEITYDGQLLWKPPNIGQVSQDSIERYHHEINILSNGNYMVLGNELIPWEWRKDSNGDSALSLVSAEQMSQNTGKTYPRISFGTVIEYDQANNVVWSWRSSQYFLEQQTNQKTLKNLKNLFDSHENGFAFDEKNKNLYVSFKNFSQIFKINYPDGIVTNVYGKSGDPITDQKAPFCHQHSVKIFKNGNICLFNNNICHPDETPTALMMQEPAGGKGNLKKIWEYKYPYKGDFTELRKAQGTSGGNVMELPGGEILVSMCNPYGNVFIVSMDKKLLWDAVLEVWNLVEKKWSAQSAYRYSIITSRNNLGHLIWRENIEGR